MIYNYLLIIFMGAEDLISEIISKVVLKNTYSTLKDVLSCFDEVLCNFIMLE